MLAAAGLGEAAATEVAQAIVKSAEAGAAASWAAVSARKLPRPPRHRSRPSSRCGPRPRSRLRAGAEPSEADQPTAPEPEAQEPETRPSGSDDTNA